MLHTLSALSPPPPFESIPRRLTRRAAADLRGSGARRPAVRLIVNGVGRSAAPFALGCPKTELLPEECVMPNRFQLSLQQKPLITLSPRMQQVMDLCERVARTDAPVLILAESGSGKERIARHIHETSSRRDQPFVAVNCSALPDELLSSELFGHEQGAFTNAVRKRIGRFELASGGTLFLDELGGVSEQFQLHMLRVLQDGNFTRTGGQTSIDTNVRIVAATNADLAKKAREGAFRQDLFYRLSVFPIPLPPLRERPEDLDGIVENRLQTLNCTIAPHALARLRRHRWPGNIRELENVLERAFILSGALDTGRLHEQTIRIDERHIQIGEHFDAADGAADNGPASFARIDAALEEGLNDVTVVLRMKGVPDGEIYDACEAALGDVLDDGAKERTGGVAKAAELLGRSRAALYRRRRRNGCEAPPRPVLATAGSM